MTAVNIILQSNAAHLFVDGGVYGADGKVAWSMNKVFLMPQAKCAMAFRGPSTMPAMIHHTMQGLMPQDFDGLRREMPDAVREHFAPGCPIWKSPDFVGLPHAVEIYVAGWSETEGSASFTIWNHDAGGMVEPFKALSMGSVMCVPGSPAIPAIMSGRGTDEIDIQKDGIAMMEAMRKERIPHQSGRAVSPVNCFVNLTTVTEDQISSRIIHKWDKKKSAAVGARQ